MARIIVNIPTSGNIGDIKSAMLTLAQFQTLNGTNWVLANGSSAVGTVYATLTGATVVPDLRGQVLRGKNNGRADGLQDPSGERAIGAYQADQFASHQHAMNADGRNVLKRAFVDDNIDGTSNTASSLDAGYGYDQNTGFTGGTSETRMKNIAVNYFIKVS